MMKKQQMRWSAEGAHLLLQTTTAILNGDLQKHFERGYPGLQLCKENKMQIVKEAA